jgi:DHA2 family multidrug resistance protein
MVGHLTPYDPAYMQQLAAATQALTPASDPVLAQMQAQGLIYNTLLDQASLWAFVENFQLFGFLCLSCLPLVLLFKRLKPGAGGMAAGH